MAIKKPLGISLVIGLLAMAFAAMPALAQAETVTLKAGGVTLAPGTEVQGNSSNLKFATEGGPTLECTVNHVEGEVTVNPGATIEILAGEFTGAGGAACPTNVPGLTAVITPINFPWVANFTKVGTAGISEIRNVEFQAVIGAATCVYGGTVADSFTVGSALGDVIAGQTLPLLNAGAGCPPRGVLSGTVTITSGGNAVVPN